MMTRYCGLLNSGNSDDDGSAYADSDYSNTLDYIVNDSCYCTMHRVVEDRKVAAHQIVHLSRFSSEMKELISRIQDIDEEKAKCASKPVPEEGQHEAVVGMPAKISNLKRERSEAIARLGLLYYAAYSDVEGR